MLLDIQYTMNVIMKNELVKDIRDACGGFVHVHCNAVTRIIMTEATLPVFVTVWFDDRCITTILSMSKEKNKYHVMYDGAEVDQFIMVVPDKNVLFDESRNGLYYHDMEDYDFVLVNTVEENQE